MAVNFPNNPTDGEVFTASGQSWTYDAASSLWALSTPPGGGAGHLQLTGGTLTGDLSIDTNLSVGGTLGVTGDATVSGKLTLSGDPTTANHAARKGYVDTQVGTRLTQAQGDARYLKSTSGDKTDNQTTYGRLNVYSRHTSGNALVVYGTDDDLAFIVKTDGAATAYGPLTLNAGNPTNNAHAANKGYVDAQVATRLPLSGGMIEGQLRLANQATATNEAVRADRAINTGTGLSGGGNMTANRTLSFDTTWGDNRYIQQATKVSFNRISLTNGDTINPALEFSLNDGISWVTGDGGYFIENNSVIARIPSNGGLGQSYDVVNRASGDGRYMQQSWSLSTGRGLTGGGDGSANRAIALDFGSLYLQSTNTSDPRLIYLDGGDSSSVRRIAEGQLKTNFNLAGSGTTISAGNGLTGGGDIGSDRTIAMGTPGDIRRASGNATSETSHTHRITNANFQDMMANMLGAGTLGSYAFLRQVSGTDKNFGQTAPGSQLAPYAIDSGNATTGSDTISGTWMCLGAGDGKGCVWQRIA